MTIADRPVKLLVHAIAEVTRKLARTTPAPRGMPFFGLDMEVHEPYVLDEFCRQGIFRKYERVLIVNCGLGGAARWWAARWGCTVIGTDARAAFVHGADLLSRRAGVHGQTTFAVACDGAVPLRGECVTHTWIRDLACDQDLAALLRETYRGLRPGGHLTVDTTHLDVMPALAAAAQEAGFIAMATHRVAPVSPPHALLTALSQLEGFLPRRADEALGSALQALVAARRAAAQDAKVRVQFFAQRPS
jgi:SAM-dependent methyltransferase